MNIHEHQAKEILKEFGAPVSNGVVIFSPNEIKEKITVNTKTDEDKTSNQLKLNEVMICRGVYKRNPIKPGLYFQIMLTLYFATQRYQTRVQSRK